MKNKITFMVGGVSILELTQNKVALVDTEDLERIIKLRWRALFTGRIWYSASEYGGVNIYMHNFILQRSGSNMAPVDHINGDGLDNRKCNLRVTTKRGNALNSNRIRNARILEKGDGPYRLRLSKNRTPLRLGPFETREEALKVLEKYRANEE